MEYQVFLQAEGEGLLWVEEKKKELFTVRGAPNLKFSWEVKARQTDYDFLRLENSVELDAAQDIDYESQAAKMVENYVNVNSMSIPMQKS